MSTTVTAQVNTLPCNSIVKALLPKADGVYLSLYGLYVYYSETKGTVSVDDKGNITLEFVHTHSKDDCIMEISVYAKFSSLGLGNIVLLDLSPNALIKLKGGKPYLFRFYIEITGDSEVQVPAPDGTC